MSERCEERSAELVGVLPESDVPWTEAERAVGVHLLFGAESAVTIRELRAFTGLNERSIKGAIRGLRLRHGMPVCGEKDKRHPGYYVAQTPDEFARAVDLLMGQAIAMIRAAMPIRRQARGVIARAAGQMRMALDELEAA